MYARGLGNLAGLGDAFGDEKARLESRVGIPYTGTATTVEELQAEGALLVRVANGDVTAFVEAFHHADPFVQRIGADYLRRALDQDVNHQLAALLSPADYQALTGHAVTGEPWWRQQREHEVLAALFPILGAGSGIQNGQAWTASGFSYPADIYALGFDFGALQQAASAWAERHHDLVTPPTAEAIAVTQQAATAPTTPAGPPAGWRRSPPTTEMPRGGWYGPDGLFYTGDAPWADPHAAGRSVQPPPDAGLPPGGQSTPPTVPQTTAPADHSTRPVETPPTLPPAGTQLTPGVPVPDYYAPPSNGTDVPLSAPTDVPPMETTNLFAGMGGGTLLLVGGALVGLLLLGRKKGGRR